MFLKLSVFKVIVLFHHVCLFPQRRIKPISIVPKYLLHRRIDSNQLETFLQKNLRNGRTKTGSAQRTNIELSWLISVFAFSWIILLTNNGKHVCAFGEVDLFLSKCVKQTKTLTHGKNVSTVVDCSFWRSYNHDQSQAHSKTACLGTWLDVL